MIKLSGLISGDEVERIAEIPSVTGEVLRFINYVVIFPAVHYVTSEEKLNQAIDEIIREMEEREQYFKDHDKLIEAQRIRERTMYDVEFLRTVGYCKGVENYSRILAGRAPGSTPYTLLDYFPKDYLRLWTKVMFLCHRFAACRAETGLESKVW